MEWRCTACGALLAAGLLAAAGPHPALGQEPPSILSARWVGFAPALVLGAEAGSGAWIAGPFAEAGGAGWVTDTLSGLTAEVRLIWREAADGRPAELSAEAGAALGLAPGALANVAVYVAPGG
jgi:hypothetical protein